ncbi:chemotaxis protein CheW [Xylophilus sp. ASV27]|uniref:chemotaxis protein CheW n=1 Tax=Xylophilus sp. ASV27 TaxID=2795129 RepID=UPI0018EC3E08|nr:chemotaxis protein CheW [Xylophilus sp. ASV27]
MANRQALRELQSRLASRLQAAQSEGASVEWLAAEIGGRPFLFPLGQAGEIFPWTTIQPVPYTQPWFLGVANLRGGLCGVVDLLQFAAARGTDAASASVPPRRIDGLNGEASLLAFNAALGVQCALIVDRLAGLRGGEAFVSVQPRADDAPAWLGPVYIDTQGAPWQEIDLQALARYPFFLSISS